MTETENYHKVIKPVRKSDIMDKENREQEKKIKKTLSTID